MGAAVEFRGGTNDDGRNTFPKPADASPRRETSALAVGLRAPPSSIPNRDWRASSSLRWSARCHHARLRQRRGIESSTGMLAGICLPALLAVPARDRTCRPRERHAGLRGHRRRRTRLSSPNGPSPQHALSGRAVGARQLAFRVRVGVGVGGWLRKLLSGWGDQGRGGFVGSLVDQSPPPAMRGP